MTKEYSAYKRVYSFLRVIILIVFRFKIVGQENIPTGAALICANHSSNFDAMIVSLCCGIKTHVHYMAKSELFRIPIVGGILHAIGSFPVDRDTKDLKAIKTSMKYLKSGEKVGIFPEGRRITSGKMGAAKRGAVKIADQMHVPIVPIFVPVKKKIFHKYTLVVGKPYDVNPLKQTLTNKEYNNLADDLMLRIAALQQK